MRLRPTLLLAGFGLIITAVATPTKVIRERALVERDATAIQSNIADINSKTIALGDDITAYTGGDTSAIEKTSTDLVATINAGTDIVLAGDALTSTDALNLVVPIQTLTKNVDSAISALIDKKDPVVEAGSGPSVYAQLQAQLAAATSFADALTSKVPESLKDVADELSSGIKTSIQKGIDAYADVSTPTTTASPTTSTTETTSTTDTTTTTDTTSTTETTTSPPPTSTSTTSGPGETNTSTPCETGTETPPPTSEPCETDTETPPPSTTEPCETDTETPPATTDEPCETDTETPPSTTDKPEPTETSTGNPTSPPEETSSETDTANLPEPTNSETGASPEPTGGSGSGTGSESDSGTGTSPETPQFTGAAVVNTLKSSMAGAIAIAVVAVVL